ncbi:Dph6-related ATP pyrophosphatase [Aureivirga marina]|uniref:Dph6-related ATP pyrophosphatase n=1 Tax=Aureivirga marina TaxID=1182451 RepID=UPI0018C9FE5E|nr:diphthine--ammonia ligase [Aureivirga marina]
MKKTYFNWSSGKDSALALYKLLQNEEYQVDLLLTTVNQDTERVSMHGLRIELLERQLESLKIPSKLIRLSGDVSMESYNKIMQENTLELKEKGFAIAGFGDIFLEDLKEYREKELEKVGIKTVFPIWKENTKDVLKQLFNLGFKAITVCVNGKLLDASYVGRIVDEDFINSLPENVDPCGENGEFHTFVFDGPIFSKPIDFTIGEKVFKTYKPVKDDSNCFQSDEKQESWDTGFWYCDLIPK